MSIQTIYLRPNTPKGLFSGPVEWKMPGLGNVNVQQNKQLNVTSNGIYTVTPDANYNAIEQVKINVQVPLPNVVTANVNCEFNFTSFNNADVISVALAEPVYTNMINITLVNTGA